MTGIETDYLVVGAGAMGMAFVDTILTETQARVVVVDRYDQPGGHWTLAYPFVRLHQPSAFYGVNSRELGSGIIDTAGGNTGLYELASAPEICAYYDQVMRRQFLPSGRVSYYPLSEYKGHGRFRTFAGASFDVDVRCRIVDATYMRTTVPVMRPPPFSIADGIRCIPPNGLAREAVRSARYTVVGAGKTGIDVCLWLLDRGVDEGDITWIVPRDPWLQNRARVQPGPLFADTIRAGIKAQAKAISEAQSVDDLFDRLEACGHLLRLSDEVRATAYRCATVSLAELAMLRGIRNVVRLGRVQRIDGDRVILQHGALTADPGTLYVDCTADGLEQRPAVPVFNGSQITLQAVRRCQQAFSAAFIAHVEAAYSEDMVKNDICVPIPHPMSHLDWLRTTIIRFRNDVRWAEDAGLQVWLYGARLDQNRGTRPRLPSDLAERARTLESARENAYLVTTKLERLLREHLCGL